MACSPRMSHRSMNSVDVEQKIKIALQILDQNDKHLISANANERSVTHKLAQYIELLFPNYDVDCEYNRDGDDPKVIHGLKQGANGGNPIPADDTRGVSVFPDIIIHKRGKPPEGQTFVVSAAT